MSSPFLGGPKMPAPVAAPPPPPTPDSTTIQAAKTANLQQMMARSGRQSTILTGGDQKLGG